MNSYKTVKNTWRGLFPYNLNGAKIEPYTPPVTISPTEWQQYIGSGYNVLYGSGGVIPRGTVNTGWNTGGAVYAGQVRQGYGRGYGRGY